MNKFRKELLAGAALLLTAGLTQAADLPTYKAAPVEYVRVCDAFGAGFFYIPGTDTCLRVNGAVRAEYTIRPDAPTDNTFAFARNLAGTTYARDVSVIRARAYLNADARTQTAYGTIRAYVSYRITTQSTEPGPFGGGSYTPAGATYGQRTSFFQGFTNPTSTFIDKGFIQFAGITAGRAQSFFDFDAQSHELINNSLANSNQPTELFAYTATFGKGFSGTISIEDRNERIIGDSGFLQSNLNPTDTKAGYLAYAGETVPDIIGNLRADEKWGSAQLAGAYHRVSSQTVVLPNGANVNPSDTDAFAAIAGVKILLPQVAKGDNFIIQGTYEKGAMDYINSINYDNGLTNVYSNNLAIGNPVNDGFVLPGGRIGLNTGYGGYATYQHYWTPEWNSSIYGDYVTIKNPYAAQLLTSGADNADIWQVGGNLNLDAREGPDHRRRGALYQPAPLWSGQSRRGRSGRHGQEGSGTGRFGRHPRPPLYPPGVLIDPSATGQVSASPGTPARASFFGE